MHINELKQLGYDTEDLSPDLDYVPGVMVHDGGVTTELVHRPFLQLQEINEMGGIAILGGRTDRHGRIYNSMEEGLDLMTAVFRHGDEQQKQTARELIFAGKVSS